MILNQLMSDFETDGKDFEADSWSLAVDNSYLQQHKMDVMKRQDVIYGERDTGMGQGCRDREEEMGIQGQSKGHKDGLETQGWG